MEEKYRLPCGYTTLHTVETVSPGTAVKTVLGRKKRRCGEALWDGEGAALIRDVWVCPYCGNRVPAYGRYFGSPSAFLPGNGEIREWAFGQVDLFGNGGNRLKLQEPIGNGEGLECPHCFLNSGRLSSFRDVVVRDEDGTVSVTAELTDVGELFSVNRAPELDVGMTFPLFERAVFLFAEGKVLLQLLDGTEKVLTQEDVTERHWRSGPVCEVLNRYTVVRRALAKRFSERVGHPLPFPGKELTPERFVLMTRFRGFCRGFYDAIPFSEGMLTVEKSFSDRMRRLHTAREAVEYADSCALPKAKSVRRHLFTRQGLLWYLPECETLWKAVGNVDLFRRLMTDRRFFDILISLHSYPGTGEYYSDFARTRSGKALVGRLTADPGRTGFDAAAYCAMAPLQKEMEREKWKKRGFRAPAYGRGELSEIRTFSVPTDDGEPGFAACMIDGFRFRMVRSLGECREIGRDIGQKELGRFRSGFSVVGVFSGERAVAAVEVCGRAYIAEYLTEPEDDSGEQRSREEQRLRTALEKWESRYWRW